MVELLAVKEALNLVYGKQARLFDIRRRADYLNGHIPMAVHVGEEELREKIQGNSTEKIILYCDYGNRSLLAAKELLEEGYENVASMVGGYHAYEGYVETKKNDLWTMDYKYARKRS